MKISGEVCPHHIALTDEAIQNFDTNYKMNPPLRTQRDVDAILEGIADGTLSILCSDHAPHAQFEKEVEFDRRRLGFVGLETELGIFLDLLVHKHRKIDLPRLIEMYTVEPARLLKLEAGTLSIGAGRCDLDRSGPGMDGEHRRFPIAVAQFAVRRLETERPRGADDRRRKNGVEIVAAVYDRRKHFGPSLTERRYSYPV